MLRARLESCVSEAAHEYFTDCKALLLVDKAGAWDVEWLELDGSEVPLLEVQPGKVLARVLLAKQALWPITRRPRLVAQAAEEPMQEEGGQARDVPGMGAEDRSEAGSELDDIDEWDLIAEPGDLHDVEEAWQRMDWLLEDLGEAEAAERLVDFHSEEVDVLDDDEPMPAQGSGAADQDLPAAPAGQAEPAPEAHRAVPLAIAVGPRLPAEALATFVGLGKIAFHQSKQSFEATCFNHRHGHCVLSRTCKGRALRHVGVVAGRPLGFLVCWILQSGACDSKAQHWDKDTWKEVFSLEARQKAREQLMGMPGGPTLAAHERARAAGEPEEPTTLEGLL